MVIYLRWCFLFNFCSYSGQSLVVNDVFPPILKNNSSVDSDNIDSDFESYS